MAVLSEEELNNVIEYAKQNNSVSVPIIQKQWGWSYSKARKAVEKLVEQKNLESDEGIFYTYRKSAKEIMEELENYDDDYDTPMEGFYRSRMRARQRPTMPFSLSVEEKIIGRYVGMMNVLGANARAVMSDKAPAPPPKNLKLPRKYQMHPQRPKDLVAIAIKSADKRNGARFGLFEASKRWKSSTEEGASYKLALEFIETITDADFKRIKYILTHDSPQ